MATQSISRSCLRLSSQQPAPASVARVFLQLAHRRTLHTTSATTSSAPFLDFLVPRISPPSVYRNYTRQTISTRSVTHLTRSFTSSSQHQTSAIVNPRTDDDGNDMNVEITPRASNRLKEIMAKDSNPDLALRIQVESGGCHGFQYLMSLTTLPLISSSGNSIQGESQAGLSTSANSNSTSGSNSNLDEDDTVFAADDGSGAKVVMDGPSLELLKGSKIDYTMELIGSQFKIVDNPLATSSCGCGTSFDIKA